MGRVNFDHRLVSAACVRLNGFLHTKHIFNPQHHQTPSESLRPGEGFNHARFSIFVSHATHPAASISNDHERFSILAQVSALYYPPSVTYVLGTFCHP
jgi:hypothetical protein